MCSFDTRFSERNVPAGSEIGQLPATLLALHGLAAELDYGPVEAILETGPERAVHAEAASTLETSVYTEEEEARMIEKLRDLGYE